MRSIAPGPDAHAWRPGTSARVRDRRARADGAAMKGDRATPADRRGDLLVAVDRGEEATNISGPVGSGTTCLLRARAGGPARARAHRIAMVRYGATSSRLSFQAGPARRLRHV